MKQVTLVLLLALCSVMMVRADSLWIETDATGNIGKQQVIKVIFGSYNQYRLQKVTGEFQEVKDFTCWVVSPSGKNIPLRFTAGDTSYNAVFTPEENGTYVVLLENKQRKVEDWSKSSTKIGITKQHYYARTSFSVGNSNVIPVVLTDLTLVKCAEPQNGGAVTVQVLLHGKPVADAVLFMRHPEMEEQKLVTDKDGKVSFTAPRHGRYFALVTLKFESPGTYKGVHYDVFREKSTLTMVL